MATAEAKLTTLDEARREIAASGAEKVSDADLRANQVWLIQVRGEFVFPQFRGFGILPSSTPRAGVVYGVVSVNTGSLGLVAFSPE